MSENITSYEELTDCIGRQMETSWVFIDGSGYIDPQYGRTRVIGILERDDEKNCFKITGERVDKDSLIRNPGTFPCTINKENFKIAQPALSE